jgi:hypothetical protein
MLECFAIACSAARLGLEAQNAAAFRLLRLAGRIVAPTPNRGLRAIASEQPVGTHFVSPQKGRACSRQFQRRNWSPCQCTLASQSLASPSYIMVRSSKPKSSGGPASGNKSPITC